MNINKFLLTVLFLFFCKIAICQEQLTPIQYNAILAKHKPASSITTRSGTDTIAIGLPFIDDFSYSQKYPQNAKYPNQALWVDSQVYINDYYGVNPPTIGVATFDGLNQYGLPYSSSPFDWGGADTLTSRPINLRDSLPSDSIYLSFFYQPQGLGDSDLNYDSLVLEFRDNNGQWDEKWFAIGDTVVPFQQVIIAVDSLKYFTPGFQFRFRNYTILSGNNNNWNIDYVKMAAKRNDTTTVLHDVAFQYNSQSILKNYTQMPWYQFYKNQTTELRDSFHFTLMNNFSVVEDVDYIEHAFDLNTGNLLYKSDSPAINIQPQTNAIQELSTFQVPTNISYLNYLGDSVAEITVRTNIKAINGDENRLNDTVYHNQYFSNYYAYDDGTAETAYSLLGDGSTAPELALQFHLNRPDTLRALQIYFTLSNSLDSNAIFVLQEWSSLFPEVVAHTDSFHYSNVTFVDSLTGFATYVFQHPDTISDTGNIYVGLLLSDANTIYIGYDVNDNDSMNLYYNVGNGFVQSQFHGTVMIRPVFGRPLQQFSTGIAPRPALKEGYLSVYPDPANDLLNFAIKNANVTYTDMAIENIFGQTVMNETSENLRPGLTSTININSLPAGVYFLRLTDEKTNSTITTKFVKSN